MAKKTKMNKTQIRVAIIGLVGVIVAALITAWATLSSQRNSQSKRSEKTINQRVEGNKSNAINNNSGEINIRN